MSPFLLFKFVLITCRSKGFKIRGGNSYYLKITPQVHSATQSFADLSLENRKCKLNKDVQEDSFLNTYSEQGCVFECVLGFAVSHVKV